MGIESDQLVFDYLCRVGDLAQRQLLPAAERMRLVAHLRSEIDQRRADAADSPAAVRKILGKLGTPADVVAAAGSSGTVGYGGGPLPEVPGGGGPEAPGLTGPAWPSSPSSPASSNGVVPPPRSGGFGGLGGRTTPPHLAGEGEVGPSDETPDWWRIEPGPFGSPGETVPGFVGGIEIPEILKPPPGAVPPQAPPAVGVEKIAEGGPGKGGGGRGRGRGVSRLVRRVLPGERAAGGASAGAVDGAAGTAGGVAPADGVARGRMNPLLVGAAALLVAGALLGNLIVLGVGWLLAYWTRKLSRPEAKLAVMGVPGAVAAGAIVWVWGRFEGRWGDPIPKGGMAAALTDTWPVAVRVAACASAAYLLWRASRLRRG
ncbi:hypothetical protein ACH429_17035 [Streptomyces pathocidini]|uniref:Integral membrane protein n=1 Tax=Streptomyces pathocidini TaxID=1650571 RepID=A0ABW7UT41_9ACTN